MRRVCAAAPDRLARMSADERRAHDKAWGLDFGDPTQIELVPPPDAGKPKRGLLSRLFGGATPEPPTTVTDPDAEHP